MIKNVYWSSDKVAVIFVRLQLSLFFYRQAFEKYSDTKFHENPSSWSRVVPCGKTDITKLIVAFRNFGNARKTVDSWEP